MITIKINYSKNKLKICKQFLSIPRLIKLIKLVAVRYVLILNVSKIYEHEEKFVNNTKWIFR